MSKLSTNIIAVVIPALLILNFPQIAHGSTILTAAQDTEETSTAPNKERSESLDFSGTGRPGQQTAGDNRGYCPYVKDSLTAITPSSNFGKTIAEYPSFWFYSPYNSRQVKQAEFVLQDRERKTIFRSQIDLQPTPGYNQFSLPKISPSLKVGKSYRWYVKLYCDRSISSADNTLSTVSPLFVQGWIERVPLSSYLYLKIQNSLEPTYQVYGSDGIWYDAINELLSLHLLKPHNSDLQADWLEFTKAKGVNLQIPQLN